MLHNNFIPVLLISCLQCSFWSRGGRVIQQRECKFVVSGGQHHFWGTKKQQQISQSPRKVLWGVSCIMLEPIIRALPTPELAMGWFGKCWCCGVTSQVHRVIWEFRQFFHRRVFLGGFTALTTLNEWPGFCLPCVGWWWGERGQCSQDHFTTPFRGPARHLLHICLFEQQFISWAHFASSHATPNSSHYIKLGAAGVAP